MESNNLNPSAFGVSTETKTASNCTPEVSEILLSVNLGSIITFSFSEKK